MAMTKQRWSVNALAVEFSMDRRTVAKRIQHIKPAGQERGAPVWHLADVALFLAPDPEPGTTLRRPASAPPAPPPGFECLARLRNPADAMATFMALCMVYRIPRIACSVAVGAGAPLKAAYAMHSVMTIATMQLVEEIGRGSGIEPFRSEPEPDIYHLDYIEGVNWESLAEAVGEPVDLDAWKAHSETRFKEDEAA